MAKTIKQERLRWVKPIANKAVRLVEVAKVCPYGKRTLERWVAAYKKGGEKALEPESTRPKTNPLETPIRVKERIQELRDNTGKCALKLSWDLEDEGTAIHPRTVGKILKEKGLVRKYRVKRVKYKYLKALRQPGDLIEIDVKYVPGKLAGKQYFQYTAIDCASRWRYLGIYEEQANHNSVVFLREVMARFPYVIKAIKTDNHSTFTNWATGYQKSADPLHPRLHALDLFCAAHGIIHYLIDPGKPAQNGTVERSHRSDQESLYDQKQFANLEDLRYGIRLWTMYYNDLQHCGLNGRSPNQFLKSFSLNMKPPKVCT
jgi:transposase InsO family protein